MQRKRVLHFIESGGVYGAESVILNLSSQMQCTAEFDPVVGCIVSEEGAVSDLYNAAQDRGIEAVKIVIPNRRLLIALPMAAKSLKSLSIDLIHSHGYKPSVFGFVIKLLTGIPIMTTCHLWFEPTSAPLKMRVMLKLESLVYRWFPKVVAVSEAIKETLVEKGIDSIKVEVLKNGVEVTKAELSMDQKAVLRSRLGVGDGSLCILNAGRLTRQKGQWTLIEAAALLRNSGVDFHVLIVGEGRLREELNDKIVCLELENHVSLLGFRSDMPELLAISDVFAMPSLDEGMPMSLLEATAAEVPVTTTAVGDIPKLIKHEETGLIIPKEDAKALADALKRLGTDVQLGRNLTKRAKEVLEQEYSSAAMAEKYHCVYRGLIGSESE